MNILFMTTSPLEYNSSANMRNIGLITGLLQLGHDVTTISGKPDMNSKYMDNTMYNNLEMKKRYFLENKTYKSLSSENTHDKGYIQNFKKIIKRTVYRLFTKLSIYDPRRSLIKSLENLKIEGSFDVIISSSDPKSSHLLAEKFKKMNPSNSMKWIQYWGDPFAADINSKTLIPKFIVIREEKRLIKAADKVVYVSPFTFDQQVRSFPSLQRKINFLPIPYIEPLIYKENNNEKFVVGYFGDYKSSDRDIVPLYRSFEGESSSKLIIYGHGDVKLDNTNNVKINQRENYSIIKEAESKCDLLVSICNRRGTQIPGKIYHYAATNKPILIILDGENSHLMRKYFQKFNRYIICDNNKKSISDAIKEIMSSNKSYEPSRFFKPTIISEPFIKI